MGPREITIIHEHNVRRTSRNRSWAYGRSRASTSIHEHPLRCAGRSRSWAPVSAITRDHSQASCALHMQDSLIGPLESTSINEHPRAFTIILCADLAPLYAGKR